MSGTFRPQDRHDQALLANVRPPDWRNPTPRESYDLVVIGAGTAGLITSLVASSLGASVALLERDRMGGDCLNVGCVPSKSLIRASRLVAESRRASELGLLPTREAVPDFARAMERMREIRARISRDDSAARYSREFGVDVYFGEAAFAGPASVSVGKAELRFRRAVISSGARAAAPPVPGLAECGHLTNESVFELARRPARLAVIGAGPIGCELAQAFARMGSRVSLLERGDQILPREDADAAAIVQRALERDGVEVLLGVEVREAQRTGAEKCVRVAVPGGERSLAVDEILVAAGRAPNVEGLALERAGVEFDARGVRVDDRLRTSNRRVFAAGDVCMDWKFTHAADAAAKLVVQNALFMGRKRVSKLIMPWCTYTDPELAHVGLGPREARERGIALDTFEVPIARANRAVTDGEEEGLVRIHVRRGSDRIQGATIVASHAGELINALTLAMNHRIGLGAFGNVIHPYPTQAEAIKAAAGLYTRTRLTPFAKRVLGILLRIGSR